MERIKKSDRMAEIAQEVIKEHEADLLLHATIKNGNTAIEPHDYIVGDFRKIIDEYGADWAEPKKVGDSE